MNILYLINFIYKRSQKTVSGNIIASGTSDIFNTYMEKLAKNALFTDIDLTDPFYSIENCFEQPSEVQESIEINIELLKAFLDEQNPHLTLDNLDAILQEYTLLEDIYNPGNTMLRQKVCKKIESFLVISDPIEKSRLASKLTMDCITAYHTDVVKESFNNKSDRKPLIFLDLFPEADTTSTEFDIMIQYLVDGTTSPNTDITLVRDGDGNNIAHYCAIFFPSKLIDVYNSLGKPTELFFSVNNNKANIILFSALSGYYHLTDLLIDICIANPDYINPSLDMLARNITKQLIGPKPSFPPLVSNEKLKTLALLMKDEQGKNIFHHCALTHTPQELMTVYKALGNPEDLLFASMRNLTRTQAFSDRYASDTVFHIAIRKREPILFGLLVNIALSSDKYRTHRFGNDYTLLHLAISSGYTAIHDVGIFDSDTLKQLCSIESALGYKPLSFSIIHGSFKNSILEADTDINHKDYEGKNALFYAITKQHYVAAKALIEKGANIQCLTRYEQERLCLYLALDGQNEIINLLMPYLETQDVLLAMINQFSKDPIVCNHAVQEISILNNSNFASFYLDNTTLTPLSRGEALAASLHKCLPIEIASHDKVRIFQAIKIALDLNVRTLLLRVLETLRELEISLAKDVPNTLCFIPKIVTSLATFNEAFSLDTINLLSYHNIFEVKKAIDTLKQNFHLDKRPLTAISIVRLANGQSSFIDSHNLLELLQTGTDKLMFDIVLAYPQECFTKLSALERGILLHHLPLYCFGKDAKDTSLFEKFCAMNVITNHELFILHLSTPNEYKHYITSTPEIVEYISTTGMLIQESGFKEEFYTIVYLLQAYYQFKSELSFHADVSSLRYIGDLFRSLKPRLAESTEMIQQIVSLAININYIYILNEVLSIKHLPTDSLIQIYNFSLLTQHITLYCTSVQKKSLTIGGSDIECEHIITLIDKAFKEDCCVDFFKLDFMAHIDPTYAGRIEDAILRNSRITNADDKSI